MKILRTSFALILLTFVAACSSEDAPTLEDVESYVKVRSRLATDRDFQQDFFEIRAVEIIAKERMGSALEPKMTLKVKAQIHLTEDLYREGIMIDNIRLISPATKAGAIMRFTFLLDAEKPDDRWIIVKQHKMNQSGDEINGGAPLSYFEKSPYVFDDTPEAKALFAKSAAKQKAREKAEEENRLAREAEQAARLAKIAVEKRAKMEAEKQRLAALEKARLARVTALRAAISGVWIAEEPFTKDGSYYELNHGYRLEIPKGADLQGIAKITGFKRNNPSIATTLNAVYKIDKSGTYWSLKEDGNVRIGGDYRYPYTNNVWWRASTSGGVLNLKFNNYKAKLVKINIAKSTQKKAKLRAKMSGIWVATAPLTKNGNIYTHKDRAMTVRLEFSNKTDTEGTAKGRFFVDGYPDTDLSFDLRYTLDETGERAWIYTPNDVKFKAMDWGLGGLPWRFEIVNGGASLSIKGNSEWYFPLKKLSDGQLISERIAEAEKQDIADRRARIIAQFGARKTEPHMRLGGFHIRSSQSINLVITAATEFGDQQFIQVYGKGPYGANSEIGLTVAVERLLERGETGIIQLRKLNNGQQLYSGVYVKKRTVYRTREGHQAAFSLKLLAKL